ncbi:DUF6286 domain-containing protein [Brachybacterium phenoliresistens]|uniref:DUF6286 domain-containing protein n=1 Tax=Brachybacterium phenoliresistens TaxID=396014 RepID=UPI0004B82B89|nr:DUF6286 domain-containing protein [Brachybacterium phenoliresistens]
MSTSPRPLVARPTRTVPATLLALALLTAGGLALWALGALLLTGSWPAPLQEPMARLGALRLADRALLAAAAGCAVLGIVLLVAALRPGRPRTRAVLGDAVPGTTALPHRDLERRLRARLEQVDGVRSARAAAGPRTVRITVSTVLEDTAPVLAAARRAAHGTIAEIRPVHDPRVLVRARRTS